MNKTIIIFIFLIFILVNCDQLVNEVKTGIWETIAVNDEYYIWNNMCGDALGESKLSVFSNIDGTFGWEWSRANATENNGYINPSYPSIVFGYNPFTDYSSTDKLPRYYDSVNECKINLDILEYKQEGAYDTAIDIWLTDTGSKSGKIINNIQYEIMVIYEFSLLPSKNLSNFNLNIPVTDGINNYTLRYSGIYNFYDERGNYITNWNLVIITPNFDKIYQEINIKNLLNNLTSVDPKSNFNGLYISSIEFGNEVFIGSGNMKLSNFKITLK